MTTVTVWLSSTVAIRGEFVSRHGGLVTVRLHGKLYTGRPGHPIPKQKGD